jgi:HSP20 family protein
MDWKRIAPWNWFKDEASNALPAPSPARRDDSIDPFSALRTEMDRLFDDTFRRSFAGASPGAATTGLAPPPLRPSVDISEGKKAYTVRADLPGVEVDDLSLEVEGHTLVIRAEMRKETEEDDEGFHCIERAFGAAERTLSLPDDADVEAIEAKFKNGVLKLSIPKHPAKALRGRSIEIQGT